MPVPSVDPWVVVHPGRGNRRGLGPPVRVALVALLAAAGPVLAVADNGEGGRRGAAWLAVAAVLGAIAVVLARSRSWWALVPAAAVAGPVLAARSEIGRLPPLVVLAVVVVADLALVAGRRARGPAEVVGPALAALAVAQAHWARSQTVPLTVVLLLLATGLVALHRGGVAPVVRLARGLHRAGTWAGSAVGVLAVLAVALPTLYLAGAVARVGRALTGRTRAWDDGRSGWTARATTAGDLRRDATQPFATTPAGVRARRTLTGLLVLALVAGGALVLRERRAAGPPAGPSGPSAAAEEDPVPDALAAIALVPFSERPAFAGFPQADEVQAETLALDLRPSSVGGYEVADVTGDHVNVRDGVRRTVEPGCACPSATVWLAGGSGAFGYGQRDDHTIASELVRVAEEAGVALEVINLGVPGWTLWQEVQGVAARLASGAAPPDMVVYYDGYNDVLASVLDVAREGAVPDAPAVLVDQDWSDVLGSGPRIDELGGGPDAVGRAAAARYGRLRDLADGAGGVPTEFVFQPDALGSPRQSEPVLDLYAGTPLLDQFQGIDQVLEAAVDALGDDVTDLRHLLDDAPEPLFLDSVHTNEEGARQVAGAIWAAHGAALRAAAEGTPP